MVPHAIISTKSIAYFLNHCNMPALNLSNAGFASYLAHPSTKFVLDLHDASMEEVINAYIDFKRRTRSTYSMGGLVYNLKELETEFGVRLMPIQVTDIFYAQMLQWLRDCGLSYSTIENYFTNIRTALTWAAKHNCVVSDTYDNFDVPKYNRETVALTADQVSHIYHFDLKCVKRRDYRRTLEKVRDMFVLSCNLGQRHSDMVRIQPMHFNDQKTVFTILQKKTNNKARVDIDKYSISPKVTHEILRKYNYAAPYTTQVNTYNRHLRELLTLIGGEFSQKVRMEEKIDGLMMTLEVPMYELISSHTARRTFITHNIITMKRTEIETRRCSGHTDSRSFCRYLCYDD